MKPQILALLRQRWVIPTSVGVTALTGGFTIGYILAKRRYDKSYELVIEETYEVAVDIEVEEPEADVDKTEEDVEPVQEPEPVEELEREIFVAPRPDPTDDTVEYQTVNLIPVPDYAWDYEAELSSRKADEPYIIHQDEFFNEEMGYRQITLTYYKGDDILVDEKDVPIYNHGLVVGPLKFGHGAKDPNVVYIRNEKLEGEYEILRSEGHYAVEVLGHEIETKVESEDESLKHSLLRFRQE